MGAENIRDLTQERLWKAIDGMSAKIDKIHEKIEENVRVQEKVNAHGHMLKAASARLDDHDNRIRKVELFEANEKAKVPVEKIIGNIKEDINEIEDNITVLYKAKNIDTGKKDTAINIFKWICGILSAIVIYKFTEGI